MVGLSEASGAGPEREGGEMNKNYSVIHYRFPFSSFLLFVLLREGKNARNGQAQDKITFQLCSG